MTKHLALTGAAANAVAGFGGVELYAKANDRRQEAGDWVLSIPQSLPEKVFFQSAAADYFVRLPDECAGRS